MAGQAAGEDDPVPSQSVGICARVGGLAAKLAEKPAQPVEPAVCVAGDAVRPAVAPTGLTAPDLAAVDSPEGTAWMAAVPSLLQYS